MKYNLKIDKERVELAKARYLEMYRGNLDAQTPFAFTPDCDEWEAWIMANSYSFGEMNRDFDKAIEAQVNSINYQTENFPDTDAVPSFRTFILGEGIVPSMFGSEQMIVEDQPPFQVGRILGDITEVKNLPERINPEKDGWGPRVKELCQKWLDETGCQVPIEVNDHQSPYGVATKLIGNEDLIYAMYDEPELVHKLLDICTNAIIDAAEAMQSYCGKENVLLNPACPVAHPDAGIILWDDYVSVISPDLYDEFCVPYNKRIFDHFGRGHLHTCGPVFPGYIDGMMACKPKSIDLNFLRNSSKTKEDMLELRKIATENGVILNGGLTTHTGSSFEGESQDFDKDFLIAMARGGLFFKDGGTSERARMLSEWLKEV